LGCSIFSLLYNGNSAAAVALVNSEGPPITAGKNFCYTYGQGNEVHIEVFSFIRKDNPLIRNKTKLCHVQLTKLYNFDIGVCRIFWLLNKPLQKIKKKKKVWTLPDLAQEHCFLMNEQC